MQLLTRWSSVLIVGTALALLACIGWWAEVRQASAELRVGISKTKLEEEFLRRRFPTGAIQTAPAADEGVCHDWAIQGETAAAPLAPDEVEARLEAHGYLNVSRPAVGDLVVYRDAGRVIQHSAIVRALGDQSLVLVESKWGSLGRYLHRLELPELGLTPEFYRVCSPWEPVPLGE